MILALWHSKEIIFAALCSKEIILALKKSSVTKSKDLCCMADQRNDRCLKIIFHVLPSKETLSLGQFRETIPVVGITIDRNHPCCIVV